MGNPTRSPQKFLLTLSPLSLGELTPIWERVKVIEKGHRPAWIGDLQVLGKIQATERRKMPFVEEREMPLKNARHWISSLPKRNGVATVRADPA